MMKPSVCILALIAASCGASFGLAQEAPPKTKVRVALFPYLPPDRYNEPLRARIEAEFEAKNPDLDVEIRKLDAYEDFYDPYWVAGLLRGPEAYDIVEIDTVILGTLLDLEAIAEWGGAADDYRPIAHQATRAYGKTFGAPHWMCGHFVMTTYPSVAQARSVGELTAALAAAKPGTPNLVGDLLGSWNMPALYLDAWADSRSTSLLLSALRVPVDTDVVAGLRDLFAQGAVGDTNPCLDGTYDDNNLAPEIFGTGNADALLGYSERLHYAVQTKAQPGKLDSSSILIASAPLGEGTDPIWFIDAFVTPRSFDKSVPEEQQSARRAGAKRFISYMNDAQTFAWIHQSKDLGADAAPRYLLPATRSAFGVPAIAQDPIMQQIRPLLDQGTFFPQHQIPGIRRVMRDQVLSGVR